jgi:hypothetical protein
MFTVPTYINISDFEGLPFDPDVADKFSKEFVQYLIERDIDPNKVDLTNEGWVYYISF